MPARTSHAGRSTAAAAALALAFLSAPAAQPPTVRVPWPFYGGDQAGSKYSPLDDIHRGNVDRLEVAWQWAPAEQTFEEFGTRPGAFQTTPLMIDDVLYLSTPYNRVVALDARSGRERWSFDPEAYRDGQPASGQGFVHRGVAAWRDNERLRIFMNSRHRLISLDATTGEPVGTFGRDGEVDLGEGLVWTINRKHYASTSPPVVYRDLVIVGNGVGDRLTYKNDPPGDVRAYDARTGRLVWTFHTIPQPGEFGNETWENGSWAYTGHTNVWAPMTLDEARGLLYLPVTTPSNDYYGGRRPGANLFAESLVCLDAATGQRKWHFQVTHHGLWDYDLASPPNLVTLTVDGRTIDAVVLLTKQGFAFVFDRVTGEPVWPIEERPVPPSDVPGERAWPTQPFPTRPPAFAEQGATLEDAFDLTPELRAAAEAEMKKYRLGPLYTPPSVEGTLVRPGVWGGANWGGGAFDPDTGLLYVKTSGLAAIMRLQPLEPTDQRVTSGEVDAELVNRGLPPVFDNGIPLLRPPYAHVTAIDLNRGEISWRVPFGDDPELRQHPSLQGIPLPKTLGALGPAGSVVTRGGLLFLGAGDTAFHALDTLTGGTLWRFPLGKRVTATPMTYRTADGRQLVVVAAGQGDEASLIAFGLPQGAVSPR
jgi:quinoprotein glucose dehydrogenase